MKFGDLLRQRVAEKRKPCIYRGSIKRTQREKCCGTVQVFDCAKLKQEVWHTKCASCKHYAIELPTGTLKPCVFRGIVESGMTFCNKTGELRMILEEECYDCQCREW